MIGDYRVSESLLDIRRCMADFEAGDRVMTVAEAAIFRRTLKDLAMQERKAEHLRSAAALAGTQPQMTDLWAVPDACAGLARALLEYDAHVADLRPDDIQTFVRRLMNIHGDAVTLVMEVSRCRWNAQALAERETREEREFEAAATDAAEREAARPGTNVVLLGRERPVLGGGR